MDVGSVEKTIMAIDSDKCDGYGQCARACVEGAIEIVGGKVKLVREDHCKGYGDLLVRRNQFC